MAKKNIPGEGQGYFGDLGEGGLPTHLATPPQWFGGPTFYVNFGVKKFGASHQKKKAKKTTKALDPQSPEGWPPVQP